MGVFGTFCPSSGSSVAAFSRIRVVERLNWDLERLGDLPNRVGVRVTRSFPLNVVQRRARETGLGSQVVWPPSFRVAQVTDPFR